ncbi:MAG: anthranilate synthase component I [Ignavibacteria bacterium RBG_16_34_14]|nr:MAG: anthranilate synthase component I [Ignavibacteria bacterium RBG_16_34_14]
MNFNQFKKLAKDYNLIPIYEIITADMLTPVLAYLKIREMSRYNFLLESVEGTTAGMARYSFIGAEPETVFSNKGMKLKEIQNGYSSEKDFSIFEFLRKEIKKYKQPRLDELPDFDGGLVGFLGYENVSLIERIIKFNTEPFNSPDSIFGIYKNIIAFDHYKHQIILISNADLTENKNKELSYKQAKEQIKKLKYYLKEPLSFKSDFKLLNNISSDFILDEFFKQVEKGKQNIIEGDIFQVVISKRFSTFYTGDMFNVYRALRIINPSPYMYYLEFGDEMKIAGTSPEDLLKVKNRKATVLPIAGTRRRGKNSLEDKQLEENLINDPKELAEHTMLVDLGRNDLGRVCKYSSVKVIERMKIQKYSHVMHIVSKVEGDLADDKDSIDALMSCFPSGTVTGAPKIRAIQLINDYEKLERNIYAGSVGYFDFSGNLDMCIAIRTLFSKEDAIYWQAGAGIVADSKPELEAKEIKNKSAVMINALKYAEVIDEDTGN